MANPIQTYHWGTGYDPMEMRGHVLDWSNQPSVYKSLDGFPGVDLLQVTSLSGHAFDQYILPDSGSFESRQLGMEDLNRILSFGYGITARRSYSGGVYAYRSVPSAGALYPCELYVSCCRIEGLEEGLYHYDLQHRRLTRLRSGEHTLVPGVSDVFASLCPAATFFVTAILFRSIWKYRDRAYRYHLLDSGHLVESLVMAIHAAGFCAEVTYDFDDQQTNALLGVDPEKEVCLAVVALRAKRAVGPAAIQPVDESIPGAAEASRVSGREEIPEAVRIIHTSTSQRVRSETVGNVQPIWEVIDPQQDWFPVQTAAAMPHLNWEQAFISRRSHRNFIPKAISTAEFAYMMRIMGMYPQDSCWPHRFVSCGLLVGACAGVDPGQYWFDPARLALLLVQDGKMTDQMAEIALRQRWLALAGLQVVFVSPLDELHALWGPRGYRYALLSAGRLGHRIYMASTAIGLGCCGIGAFFDRHAAALLRLPRQSAMLYFVGAGLIRKREP